MKFWVPLLLIRNKSVILKWGKNGISGWTDYQVKKATSMWRECMGDYTCRCGI